jgi:hypothetical protein
MKAELNKYKDHGDGPFFTSLGHYYSYFWWGSKRLGGKSDFSAVGNKGQYIYVSPQKSVIIVRSGFDYGFPTRDGCGCFISWRTGCKRVQRLNALKLWLVTVF